MEDGPQKGRRKRDPIEAARQNQSRTRQGHSSLPTSLEPSSLTVGEAGDFKCLRDPPQAPCLRRPGLFSFGLHATGYNAIQLQSNASPLGAHASLSRIGSPAHPRNDCLSAAFLCPIPPPLHASRPAHLRSSF